MSHSKFAGSSGGIGAMGYAVDYQRTGAADSFPAVMIEMDGVYPFLDQFLVNNIKHLQNGHTLHDVMSLVGFQPSFVLCVFLPPDT